MIVKSGWRAMGGPPTSEFWATVELLGVLVAALGIRRVILYSILVGLGWGFCWQWRRHPRIAEALVLGAVRGLLDGLVGRR